jgi:DNA (cytosine-5)-methyltransferase 1
MTATVTADGPRIASLFTGTGALDLAVMDVYGGHVIWHSQYEPPDKNGREDKNQYAARILARHWPTVPNLGDITAVCWQCVLERHGRPDVLTGGFPCVDVSSAGQRAGLTAESRSGLWNHMARAIHVLQPRLVVIENVEGLLSAKADRGLESDAEALDEGAGAEGLLRALGAVLGDLATIGFDAEWLRMAASEVGAAHGRKRVFVLAWPAAADAADVGHERSGDARRRGHGSPNCRVAAANATGDARRIGHGDGGTPADADEPKCPTCRCPEWMHDAGGFCAGCHACVDAELGRPDDVAAHTCGVDAERRGVAGVLGGPPSAEPGEGDQRERAGHPAGDSGAAAPDTGLVLPGHDGELPAGRDALRRRVRDDAPRCGAALADADRSGLGPGERDLRPGQPDLEGRAASDVQWGEYEPAIRRWERVLGRPAPSPVDDLGRLSPVFTEWLMGLPAGWVTDTPGLTRPAMLKALGNGVVRLQAATALRMLHERIAAEYQAAAA